MICSKYHISQFILTLKRCVIRCYCSCVSRIINHYPNHFELTRKDLMVKNIKRYIKVSNTQLDM
jgi:hypothetical protein